MTTTVATMNEWDFYGENG